MMKTILMAVLGMGLLAVIPTGAHAMTMNTLMNKAQGVKSTGSQVKGMITEPKGMVNSLKGKSPAELAKKAGFGGEVLGKDSKYAQGMQSLRVKVEAKQADLLKRVGDSTNIKNKLKESAERAAQQALNSAKSTSINAAKKALKGFLGG